MDVSIEHNSMVDNRRYYKVSESGIYKTLAPLGTMANRPVNIDRFVNILKHGYFSETCDINLKGFSRKISGAGYVYDPSHDGVWVCARIDFVRTLQETRKMHFGNENSISQLNIISNFPEIRKN